MCCSKFLVYVCMWVHLEDCCRVNASCEGLLIFFVQETEDRTWILSGVSYSGVLSKCSMLGMFCTAAHKVTLFGSVTVPPHTHILEDFQASSNRVRATAWLCCPASGNSRQMAKFLFFFCLDRISGWKKKAASGESWTSGSFTSDYWASLWQNMK